MSEIQGKVMRLLCESFRSPGDNLRDQYTSAYPAMWLANAMRFEAGLFEAENQPWGAANLTSLTLKIAPSQTNLDTTLATKTVLAASISNAITLAGWEDGSEEHAVFEFSNAETNWASLFTGGKSSVSVWIVISGLDGSGRECTLGGGTMTVYQDNNGTVGDPTDEDPPISAAQALGLIAQFGGGYRVMATIAAGQKTGTVDYTALGLSGTPQHVGVVSTTRRGAGAGIGVWVTRDPTDYTATAAQLEADTEVHTDIIDVEVSIVPASS